MNMQLCKYNTFRRHARMFIEPAIVSYWQKSQEGMLQKLHAEEKVIVGGDMRADSPGHSAKFGSYTMMDLKNNKVVDLQLVQSNEVGGSYHMELEGLKRSLELLKERGVTLDCIVTDRHLQIQKFLRESSITQFFDVWHIEKATSTTGPERVAKWTSILNHVQDIHSHDDPLFPKCLQPLRIAQYQWMAAGTPAFHKLETILSNKRILKAVAKLSPHHQTSSLESFHAVILRFAPKNVVFPFLGMLCR
nr:uncharacterized protein LOC117441864 [Pseudochaenichthys georgianus]